jgi:DNA end-binding protein Ku
MARTKRKPKARVSRKVRASWRGTLRFGLVAFPVEAFNAHNREEGHTAFHQLHAPCHSRIRYERVCPIHGPVTNDEIVSGYEYGKDHYIEIEPEELEQLRPDKERGLTLDTFVDPDAVDPIYFDGRMYFLSPDGAEAKEPYAVFLEALNRQDKFGIGQIIFSGRQQIVLVRPYEGALHMAMLNYAAEINSPDVAVGTLPRLGSTDKKVVLAEQLITGWGDKNFDFGRYVDQYEEDVRKLIEAKVEGRELVVPEEEEEPAVYNLMDALRKSMAKNEKHPSSNRHPTSRPARGKRSRRKSTSRRRAS